MTGTSASIFARAAHAAGDWGQDPSAFDPAYLRVQHGRVAQLFGPGRYFDVHDSGWENLPHAPSMLVSNHSGGTTVLDGWGLGWAWYNRQGFERPLHVLAHEAVFATRTTGRFFARVGILSASPEAARRALVDFGHDLLVMPGGDQEVWRPARDRFLVSFGGRVGYARAALQLGVPIVPVAHAGAHHTLYVLTDGQRFARRTGLHHLARASVFPIHLSFPWGLGIGPWPHLPPPTRLEYRIGPPIQPEGSPDDPRAVRALDEAVRASIQRMLDELRASWPTVSEQLQQRMRGTMAWLGHHGLPFSPLPSLANAGYAPIA